MILYTYDIIYIILSHCGAYSLEAFSHRRNSWKPFGSSTSTAAASSLRRNFDM